MSKAALARVSQRTKGLLAILPVIFLIMSVCILSSSSRGIQASVGWGLLGMLVVLEGLLYVTASFLRRVMEGLSISISDKSIERHNDGDVETTPFAGIRKVSVTYNSEMKVTGVQIARNRGLGWILNGFENLDGLALALEDAVGKERFRRRTQAFDQDSMGCFAVMIISGVALGLLFVGLGRDIFQMFYTIFFGLYGLYGLVYRPYTRTLGLRMAWFEIIIGLVLISNCIWLGAKIF